MKHGQHEIYSYQKFVKDNHIYSRRKSPLLIMHHQGFSTTPGYIDLDAGDKSIEYVKSFVDGRDYKYPCTFVYYRSYDRFGLPYLEVFVKKMQRQDTPQNEQE